MSDSDTAVTILSSLEKDLRSTYGLSQVTSCSLACAYEEFRREQRKPEYNDDTPISFCIREPNDREQQFQRPLSQLIRDSDYNGEYISFLRNMGIVYANSLWEHNYRKGLSELAGDACGKNPKTGKDKFIENDKFGDLRAYRISIVHKNLKLGDDLKYFKFHVIGDTVKFSEIEYYELFLSLVQSLNEIAEQYFGVKTYFGLNRTTITAEKNTLAVRVWRNYQETKRKFGYR